MAQCSVPADVPLSPPPYEEAIRTTAPDLSVTTETEDNNEPPPSYSEATKDDVFPTPFSEQHNTSDLMELIFPNLSEAEQARQGRQSLLRHHLQTSSHRQRQPGADSAPEVTARRLQVQAQHRKKLSVCLLSAGVAVFLIAGLIAASILRHRPKLSSHHTSDHTYIKPVTLPPINQNNRHKMIWMTVNPPYSYDSNRKSIFEEMGSSRNKFLEKLKQAINLQHAAGSCSCRAVCAV